MVLGVRAEARVAIAIAARESERAEEKPPCLDRLVHSAITEGPRDGRE